jgi:hypothetical protein
MMKNEEKAYKALDAFYSIGYDQLKKNKKI